MSTFSSTTEKTGLQKHTGAASLFAVVSLPGQKLQGQLQVALQRLKLSSVTAETDIVKEESWAKFL